MHNKVQRLKSKHLDNKVVNKNKLREFKFLTT